MIDVAAILSSLKLIEFGYTQLKGKLTKKQRAEIVKQAERLVTIATAEDIQRYDTPQRQQIRTMSASAKKRFAASPGRKRAAAARKSSSVRRTRAIHPRR